MEVKNVCGDSQCGNAACAEGAASCAVYDTENECQTRASVPDDPCTCLQESGKWRCVLELGGRTDLGWIAAVIILVAAAVCAVCAALWIVAQNRSLRALAQEAAEKRAE